MRSRAAVGMWPMHRRWGTGKRVDSDIVPVAMKHTLVGITADLVSFSVLLMSFILLAP